MSNIKDINSTNFDKEVLNSELPVLIDFLGSLVWTL
jgi:thioredoxin-like negative regulator of GroEL